MQLNSSDYQFSRDYPHTITKTIKPSKKIIIVNQSQESLNRSHDLILLTNKGQGNNSLSIGEHIKLGTFPNRKLAELKRKELHQQYKSANKSNIVSRKSWDPKLDIIIKPTSLV